MERGFLHIYCGDGKGKTTAAMGLALRALGHGKRVVIVQFLKRKKSGEIRLLEELGAIVFSGKYGASFRVSDMTEEEYELTKELSAKNLSSALLAKCDILILDELLAALKHGIISDFEAASVLKKREVGTELVITGREAPGWLLAEADYVTRMTKEKHPFDEGLTAREGIEF